MCFLTKIFQNASLKCCAGMVVSFHVVSDANDKAVCRSPNVGIDTPPMIWW